MHQHKLYVVSNLDTHSFDTLALHIIISLISHGVQGNDILLSLILSNYKFAIEIKLFFGHNSSS